jgi:hypothetical protein
MKKLSVNLKNCYGISHLSHNFDFEMHRTHLIYAQNGGMKSSFAKVFSAYRDGKEAEIQDRIFPENRAEHEVKIDDKKVEPSVIFVIKPFEDSFYAKNISEILLKEEYKVQYEKIISEIRRAKEDFLAKILRHFQYRQKNNDKLDKKDMDIINHVKDINVLESLFVEVFLNKPYNSGLDFYELILKLKKEFPETNGIRNFQTIKYGVIFNDKTSGDNGFLTKSYNRALLKTYARKYKDLIEKSRYFNFIFTHSNAEKVIHQMDDAHYFTAMSKDGVAVPQNGFQLYNKLNNARDQREREELAAEVELLRKKLHEDSGINGHMAKIDSVLDGANSTKVTKKFREYILDEELDLSFLDLLGGDDVETAKKALICSYIYSCKSDLDSFEEKTKSAYLEIEELVKKVRSDETTIWHKAVAEFNSRFKVPFKVGISDANKDRILMNGLKLKSIEYWFCKRCGTDINRICSHDKSDMVTKSESDLVGAHEDSILSQGERRAFYLLNIIFEIKYRKENKLPTLFIIDDIADSFDYQNKYAIAEYLKEISEVEYFRSIILTHNFDFFRTLKSRIQTNVKQGWYYLAEKREGRVDLVVQCDKYTTEPFKLWQSKLINCDENTAKYIFTTLLMMRNIIDYSGIYKDKKNELNDLLHGRSADFENMTMRNIFELLKNVGLSDITFSESLLNKKYNQCLKECAASSVSNNYLDLEDKIIISFYIRLATEKYLFEKGFTDKRLWKKIQDSENSFTEAEYEKIKRVNLITPEHIHINSFMYEPLIDLDKNQIVNLYNDVTTIFPKP